MDAPFSAYFRELDRRDLSPTTRAKYAQILASYQTWLEARSPDPDLAREFLAHLRHEGYRPRSVLVYYNVLRSFHAFHGRTIKVKIKRPRDLPAYYSHADIERLIKQARRGLYHHTAALKNRNFALVATLAFTGMRRNEAWGLKVGDVDFRRLMIVVRQDKGGKDRVIPIHERIVEPLWSQCLGKPTTARVFDGMSPWSINKVVTHLARACDLKGFHPHSFRHAFATRLVE